MSHSGTNAIEKLEGHLAKLRQKRDEITLEITETEKKLESARATQDISTEDSKRAKPRFFEQDLLGTRSVITKSSSIQEKYELFYELFSGRQDVHARRYESAKSGVCGYTPACSNDFKWGICKKTAKGKDKIRCVDCKHQAFVPIALEAFEAHIQGKAQDCSDVLGSYPMDKEDSCKFVLVDFDEEGRKEKLGTPPNSEGEAESPSRVALVFCEFCWSKNIPVYLERSRSGRGFHVWLFFTDAVPARSARQLLSYLLTASMQVSDLVQIKHYDMLIPRQDLLSTKGFGNLVALPLQGRAGRDRNSLFVDETLRHYPDQWEFLSTIRKMTPLELDSVLSSMTPIKELGETLYNGDDEDSIIKPWEKRKPEVILSRQDFYGSVEIVRANMLHLPKTTLSSRAINKIRRLAAFDNPKFYEAQRLRQETWKEPRVICAADETNEYLSIPRGAELALTALLASSEADYSIEDMTEQGRPIQVTFKGLLRDEQAPAAEALLKHDIGTLSAPTGFGKTVLAAYLIAERAVNALILVSSRQLLGQWLEELNKTLDIRDEPPIKLTAKGRKKKVDVIGQYWGNKKNTSGIIDVAMIQSLQNRKTREVLDFIKDYGLVIVDECHHAPAVSFEAVLKHINAKYVYGLSATPFRDDGRHPLIFLECGPIRYKVDHKEQALKRPFEHYLVPRFTSFLPSSVHDEKNFSQVLNDIGADDKRNEMIRADIVAAIKSGRKSLVLTERTEHVGELLSLLDDTCENIICLVGTMSDKEKRESNAQLTALKPDDEFVIIATGKYVGEGFDFPMLDTLFITMPISFKGKVIQYTGRIHRLFEGKKDAYVYDYVDMQVPVLERMYHKRLKSYRELGYKVALEQQIASSGDVIYNRTNYWQRLREDIQYANNEVVIVGPRLVGYQIDRVLEALVNPQMKNVVVTVVTKPASAYKDTAQDAAIANIQRLKDAGIKVVENPDIHQQFAVIDKKTVWYGSINPLGYIMKDDSIIRFMDVEVAEQLLLSTFRNMER